MEMNGKYVIQSSQESVWAALNDPAVLEQCIPGCSSLERLSDTEFNAEVVAKIGPVKARFKTSVALENIDAPNSYTLVGSSKAGAAGFGKGKADVTLRPVEEGTELYYAADFKVGGKLAQVGSRLVAGATRKTADDFFGNFSSLLGAQKQAGVSEVAESDVAESSLPKWALVAAAGVLLVVAILWLR